MHPVIRLKATHWRKLLRNLALPFMLLLAQQGVVLHELSHYAATEDRDGNKQSPRGDVCSLCVAFAQVASSAAPQHAVVVLLTDLACRLTPAFPVYAGVAHLPAERSRGPPLYH
jgi:hypothetical protein